MDEQEMNWIAAQLRRPSGKEGEEIGVKMFENNLSMIRGVIDLLPLKEGDHVLELGYGNGAHLDYLFEKAANLRYTGVDISETMQKEAFLRNQEKVSAGTAEFLLGDGITLPIEDLQVDEVFSVNTVYFWEDHLAVLREVKRILKPGGSFCLALASRNFMEQLPFTKFGFRLFHPKEIRVLLEEGGFVPLQTLLFKEPANGIFKDLKEREVILLQAKKPW